MTMISNARMAQHITELCAAFNVGLEVNPRMPPERAAAGYDLRDKELPMSQRRKCIVIAPVTDETTYAVALHEIGHCLAPCGILYDAMSDTMKRTNNYATMRDVRLQLMEEEAAWEWAEHYALDWSPVMASVRDMALRHYRNNAKRYGVK